jgi:predicted ATPase
MNTLKMTTLSVKGYKSIRSIEIKAIPDFLVFVGKNNAGKSNVFDLLTFVSQASRDLGAALRQRGDSFIDLTSRKQDRHPIEVTLTFAIPEEVRSKVVAVGAGDAPRVLESVLASPHLTTLTYSLLIRKDTFHEELETEDVYPDRPPVTLVQVSGTSRSWSIAWNQVGYMKAGGVGALRPLSGNLEPRGSGSGLVQLGFGSAVGGSGPPLWTECVRLIHQWFTRVRWVSPVRKSASSNGVTGQDALDPDAANLASVLNSLRNNNDGLFREIQAETQKLVPNIRQFSTPVIPVYRGNAGIPQTTLGVQEKDTSDDVLYQLDQISAGTRSAIAVITAVLTAPSGSLVLVEEPEAHLHPDAQAGIAHFLHRQAAYRPILVTTHSPVIASHAPLESVWLVRRNDENETVATPVNRNNVGDVIVELGLRPSYNFDADAIVFVEGKDDVPVYEVWAEISGLGGRVQFIDAEGWNKMDYYANAKVVRRRRANVEVFVILDGDTAGDDRTRKIKERLVADLNLPEDHTLTLELSEAEGYLLNPAAILKVFPKKIPLIAERLEERLAPFRKRRNQKKCLDKLFQEYSIGRYSGDLGAKIAQADGTTPDKIDHFFQKIKTALPK